MERARAANRRHAADPTSVDPEVAGAAISVCAAHGDAGTYDRFLGLHRTAANPQDSLKYLRALASFDAEEAVDRTFGLMADGTIRNQDTAWVLAQTLANRVTGPHAWSRLRNDWDDLLSRVPPMTQPRIADGFPALSEPDVAAEVRTFLSAHPLPHAVKATEQKLERQAAMVLMRERETEALAAALPR